MSYESTVYDNFSELEKAETKLAQELVEYEESFEKYRSQKWKTMAIEVYPTREDFAKGQGEDEDLVDDLIEELDEMYNYESLDGRVIHTDGAFYF
ncbi:hypothetical protein [Ligilactobacillus salivarius]|uniref:hypothetical protein n=1 Tax=Ligilactobacillus salivarius TaxID=1624 RepID=UPI0029666F08|nr:hypothetical protein [Ligilactobacillus salivarius]MDW3022877.1 hypothetical protein [Ligilactobacillus salivarius]